MPLVVSTLEVVVDMPLKNGECPIWNPSDRKLYWADIPEGRMYRYDPATETSEFLYSAGQQIGALVAQEHGAVLQFLENGRVQRWRDGDVAVVVEGIAEERGRRFNDATADPKGRVLAGTMPGPNSPACVYLFDHDGSWRVVLENVGQSNGMAFSPDGRHLYHTDTKAKQVSRYLYDAETGALGAGEVILEVTAQGVPDGLTIDHEGHLWSAHWGGACVARYSPAGRKVHVIELPTQNVSSVEFGGPGLAHLYITTAGGDTRRKLGQTAGALFRAKTAVRGLPPRLSRIF